MEVRDAEVAIDHRDARALGVDRLDVGFDLGALRFGEIRNAIHDVTEAVVRIDAELFEGGGVLLEHVGEVGPHAVAEDDRIRDLHHRRLHVQRKEDTLLPRIRDLRFEEGGERLLAHEGAVEHLTLEQCDTVLEHGDGSIGSDVLDACSGRRLQRDRGLVVSEVARIHRGDVRLRVLRPRAQPVRVVARVLLHGAGRAPVRVALAQHGIDSTSLDAVIAGLGVALFVRRRLLRVVRQVVALGLELHDRRFHLRDGGADVGQLDDVGGGREAGLAERTECVGHALLVRQALWEDGEDAAGQRDVLELDADAGRRGEGLDDRQQRVRRQRGRLIGERVDD